MSRGGQRPGAGRKPGHPTSEATRRKIAEKLTIKWDDDMIRVLEEGRRRKLSMTYIAEEIGIGYTTVYRFLARRRTT